MTMETKPTRRFPAAGRAWLALPGSGSDDLAVAAGTAADAFLADFNNSLAPCAGLERLGRRPLFVSTENPDAADFVRIAAGGVAGIAAPVANAAEIQRLGARLAVAEAETGLPEGSLGILARIAAPRALFSLGEMRGASSRLTGLLWEPLNFAPGARASARVLVAIAAAAAETLAIDGTDIVGDGFEADCRVSRDAGFCARRIGDPARIEALNRIYSEKPL